MNKLLTGQDVIKNGSGYVLAGFNRRIGGWSQHEAFKYPNEVTSADLHGGWDLADKMIREGKLYYIHNFHSSHECDGYAFQFGGFWVCNTCGRKSVDQEWWTIKIYQDGNAWCCVGLDFKDLQESDCYAFGDTREESIKNYGDLMVQKEQADEMVEMDQI